jgi:23S rRNA (adenine2503-C2)-methyltransferase
MLMERTCVMRSVRRRRPLSRTSRTIGEFDKVELAAALDGPATCRKALREKNLPTLAHSNTGRAIHQVRYHRKFKQVPTHEADTVTPKPSRPDLAELERPALEALLEARGLQPFRARQIFRWIYRHGVSDIDAMTNLSRQLRATLAAEFAITTPQVVEHERSIDGTEKLLLRLADGRQIESVFIPDTPAMTFCVSTQVGCAMACAFCLTGKMGLVRNLTAGEIVGQVRVLAEAVHLRDKRFNIVLMGMGEPLHNYDETMKALRILADEHGFAVSPRRVTLSTVGLLSALERLGREALMPNLAVSLHAPTDALRGELVPINRKYGVADIIAAAQRFPLKKRARITFEYVLLAGVNDSPDDAERLAKLLAGVKSKVNLIPLNPAPSIPFERPSDEVIDRFAQILADHHLTVSVRKSRGRDIRAACGQLIVEGERPSPGQRLATQI